MKTGTLLKRWAVAFLAIVLSICLFAIPAFADESTEVTSAEETSVESTEESVEESTEDESEKESTKETEKESTKDESEKESTKETEKESTKDTTASSNTGSTTNKKKGLSPNAIVGIILGVIVIIAAAVIAIKFREQAKKLVRVYKSESKKITWLSWEQTKKSTIVVIIVLIICAAAICLLDFGLQKGILAFFGLF